MIICPTATSPVTSALFQTSRHHVDLVEDVAVGAEPQALGTPGDLGGGQDVQSVQITGPRVRNAAIARTRIRPAVPNGRARRGVVPVGVRVYGGARGAARVAAVMAYPPSLVEDEAAAEAELQRR